MAPRAKAAVAPTEPVTHASLTEALLAVQAGLPAFQKDKVNPHFGSSYLSLESLMPQVLEVLTGNGIVLTQSPSFISGAEVIPALRTRFTHAVTGQFVEDWLPLTAGKDTPQAQGSAITYARRYAVVSALNIVADRDDDANAAQPTARRTAPVNTIESSPLPPADPGDPFGGTGAL